MAEQKWKCKHRCNQAAWLKRKGHGCPHIEALLGPHAGLGSRYSTGLDDRTGCSLTAEDLLIQKEDEAQLERAGEFGDIEPFLSDEERFRLKLQTYTTLKAAKREVLVARLVHGLTFKEIAQKLGYCDAGTAGRAFNIAMEMLKRGAKNGD